MSQEMSKFKVPNKILITPIPAHKVTNFLSEISAFFKKNASDNAIIMNVIKGIKMSEQTLFGRKSRCNSKYSLLQVFQLLLVCPCFMTRNPFNIYGSPLDYKLGCHKDVYYDFINDGRTDWRKLMYRIVCQLWTKVIIRSDHKSDDTCLMIDDTDFPKTAHHRPFTGILRDIQDLLQTLVHRGCLQGEQGTAWNGQMSVEQLCCSDCKHFYCCASVQHSFCCKTLHGLRNYRRTFQTGGAGQP